MKKVIVVLLSAVWLTLVGCSTSETEVVDSIEEMAGIWNRVGGSTTNICKYFDDGTYLCAPTLEHIDRGSGFEGRYWFEDGQYLEQTKDMSCSAIGVYEIIVKDSGNLKFELVEDDCSGRKADLIGSVGAEEGTIEWEPMP